MDMDNYKRDPRLPEGFRECLGKNAKALQEWCAMPREEQARCLREIDGLHGGKLEDYVNAMVGCQRGHGPFQE